MLRFCFLMLMAAQAMAAHATEKDHFAEFFLDEKPDSVFVKLPKELRDSPLSHFKCDCKKLVTFRLYFGSHAITHAIEDSVIFANYPLEGEAVALVDATFKELRINPFATRDAYQNIKTVATKLGLDAIYLSSIDGVICSNFSTSVTIAPLQAQRELGALSNQYKTSKVPFMKPVFFFYKEAGFDRAVVFNVIYDAGKLSILLSDNQTNPIKAGSPLYQAATFLNRYFMEDEYSMITDLVRLLAKADMYQRYQVEMESYAAMNDGVSLDEAHQLLDEVFGSWLMEKTKQSDDMQDLNLPIMKLKKLFSIRKSPQISALLLKIYDAMLDSIEKSTDMNHLKASNAAKVINALKKSAKEQRIFSAFDTNFSRVFERAQIMRTSLNGY